MRAASDSNQLAILTEQCIGGEYEMFVSTLLLDKSQLADIGGVK